MTNWKDKSWQKDFLNMKSHSPTDAQLLMGGVKGLKEVMAFRCSTSWIRKTKKTTSTRSIVLMLVENPDWNKIKLIKMINEGIRRKYYWINKNSS